MKILFICHRLPFPPKRGGKIRPFNIIRHLTESGHSVTVGSLARSREELAEGQPLREYCDKLLVGQINPASAVAHMVARLPTSIPSSMGYFYSLSLHREMREEPPMLIKLIGLAAIASPFIAFCCCCGCDGCPGCC